MTATTTPSRPLPASTGHDVEPPPRLRLLRDGVEWVGAIAVGLLIAIGVRAFAVQQYVIPSESMDPTLQVDDRVLVEKTAIDVNGINRGDVVVFDRPPSSDAGTLDQLIKRIVATEGQIIEARNGIVLVDGASIDEPYASGYTADFGPVTVSAGQVFVMGDNRSHSVDSRVFGPISTSSIVGSATVRTWPIDRIGGLS